MASPPTPLPQRGRLGLKRLCSALSESRCCGVYVRTLDPVHQYFAYAGVRNLHFYANLSATSQVRFLISIHHQEIQ